MAKLVAHIWGAKMIKEIVVGKSDMRPFGKTRHRWKDHVKFLCRRQRIWECGKDSVWLIIVTSVGIV
jgi:hypothetical protein